MSETTVTDVATGGRSGVGVASLTVSVLNFDPTLGCESATFQPCSERALSNLKFLIDAFRARFPVNQDIPDDQPVLLGDYLEDTTLGGGVRQTLLSLLANGSASCFLPGNVFLDVQLGRAAVRCGSHVGYHWRTPSRKENTPVFPAVRPGGQTRHVPPGLRNV